MITKINLFLQLKMLFFPMLFFLLLFLFCYNLFIYLVDESIDSLIIINLNFSLPVLFKETTNINLKRDMAKGDPNLKLNPMWVTGITDGEGNFSVSIIKGINSQKISLTFKVVLRQKRRFSWNFIWFI